MSDEAVAAPAAPEPVAVVEEQHNPPAPIDSRGPEKAPEPVQKPDKPVSVAESLKKADEKIKAKAEAAKPEVKPEAKTEQKPETKPAEAKPAEAKPDKPDLKQLSERARADNGRFAPPENAEVPKEAPVDPNKPREPHDEAPKRFTREAQAEWTKAPENVRKEVHRAVSEMENGINVYRGHYQNYEPVREFVEAAMQQGQNPRQVVENYVKIDRMLQQDPIKGLDHICKRMGVSLDQVARHVLGVPQDQNAIRVHQQQRAQEAQHQQVDQRISQLEQTIEQQKQQMVLQTAESIVGDWAKSNPRAEELADAIAQEIQLGYDLPTAYQRACLLNPEPAKPVFHDDQEAQTLRGQKSVSGAPAAGSAPAPKPRSSTAGEALRRAAARVSA